MARKKTARLSAKIAKSTQRSFWNRNLGQFVLEKLWQVFKVLLARCGGLVLCTCFLVLVALLVWELLVLATGCQIPVVVVLSQSMHPTYKKGDLLFLHLRKDDLIVKGDVVAFKVFEHGRELENSVAHRVIEVHEHATKDWEILTKGDNNRMDDSPLYASGTWLKKRDVIGVVYWSVSYAGWFTLLANDYPILQYILVVVLGYFL